MKETNFLRPLLRAPSGMPALSIIPSHLLAAPFVIFPPPPALERTHALDPGAGPWWEGGGGVGAECWLQIAAVASRYNTHFKRLAGAAVHFSQHLPVHASGARDPRLASPHATLACHHPLVLPHALCPLNLCT